MQHKECTLDIYELIPIVQYKERWGMQFVDIDSNPQKEEKLVKSFPLKITNIRVGKLHNHRERATDSDMWVRDLYFDVEITKELRDFLEVSSKCDNSANSTTTALISGETPPSRMEKELKHMSQRWLCEGGEKKGFRFEGDGSFNNEYRIESTTHYEVKLKIKK